MDQTLTIGVLVVDSCALSRLAMRSLLGGQPDLRVSGEVADLPSARSHCAEYRPDLIVIELELHRGSGIELLRELPKLSPASRALVITNSENSQLLERALRSGAQALVSKADDPVQLITAIRSVLNDKLFASPKFVHLMLWLIGAGKLRSVEDASWNLSDREFQVFALLGRSQGAKAIATELGVSVRTIESHQIRMKEKLRLKSCKELQAVAFKWTQRQNSLSTLSANSAV